MSGPGPPAAQSFQICVKVSARTSLPTMPARPVLYVSPLFSPTVTSFAKISMRGEKLSTVPDRRSRLT